MKPRYPRPPKTPANFVFIGCGKSFIPVLGDKYTCVCNDDIYDGNYTFCTNNRDLLLPEYDFYVEKNGPTYKLNRPISKKVAKYKVARYKMVWAVMENGRIFAKAGIRESARKIAKALNQMEE